MISRRSFSDEEYHCRTNFGYNFHRIKRTVKGNKRKPQKPKKRRKKRKKKRKNDKLGRKFNNNINSFWKQVRIFLPDFLYNKCLYCPPRQADNELEIDCRITTEFPTKTNDVRHMGRSVSPPAAPCLHLIGKRDF